MVTKLILRCTTPLRLRTRLTTCCSSCSVYFNQDNVSIFFYIFHYSYINTAKGHYGKSHRLLLVFLIKTKFNQIKFLKTDLNDKFRLYVINFTFFTKIILGLESFCSRRSIFPHVPSCMHVILITMTCYGAELRFKSLESINIISSMTLWINVYNSVAAYLMMCCFTSNSIICI